MSDFTAIINAQVDTSKAEAQLNALTKNKKVTVDVETKGGGVDKLNSGLQEANKNANSLSASFKDIAAAKIKYDAFNALANQASEAVKSVKELNDAMTLVSMTMSNMNSAALNSLKTQSMQLAQDLSVYTKTVTDAVTIYANETETAASILTKATPTALLASAAGMKASAAADSIQGIMNQFDLAEDKAMNVADVIEKLSSEISLDFSQGIDTISKAIGVSGSVVNEAGMSFEKYAAIVSSVAEETRQSGSTIGNAYKTIFSRISRSKDGLTTDMEMADAEKALNSVGVSVRGVDGDFRDVSDTLDDLNKVWGSLNKTQKSYLGESIAGVRQKNIFIATMENYNKALQLEQDALNASGTALEVNDKRADSIQGRLEKLSATMTTLYNDAIPTEAINGMLDFAITIAEVADSLGILQGALAAVGVAGGAQMIGALAANWTSLVAAFTSPIGIASLAAGGVVMAIKAISDAYVNAEEANERMQNSFTAWKDAEANVENIRIQLEETTAQYEALLGKGSWTPMEEAELERLKEATEQLQIQYELAQEKANREARQAAEDTIYAYNKNFKTPISEEKTNEYQMLVNGTRNIDILWRDNEKDLSAQIVAIREYTKLRDEAVEQYNQAKANDDKSEMEWWGEEVQRYNETNQDIKDTVMEQVDQLMDYRNILAQLPEEELAKVSGAKELLATLDEEIGYVFKELEPEKWNQMQIDSIVNSEEVKEEAEALEEFVQSADKAELSAENLREKYPELAAALEAAGINLDDFIASLVDSDSKTEEVGETVEETAETVATKAEELAASNKTLTDSISNIQSLLGQQTTGKSISLADFNAEGMEDYQSALEYVNGTMQLNAEKVNEIVKAKAEEEKATIAAAKAQDQNKYLENAGQIEKLREQLRSAKDLTDEQRSSIESNISSLLAENSTLASNCDQYNIMTAAINEATSAYQNWLNAQSAAKSGDMFDSAVQAVNHIDDTLNNKDSESYGRVGNEDYKAALDFIIPETVGTTTLIISKKPGNTGISRDIRTEFTTDLLLSD